MKKYALLFCLCLTGCGVTQVKFTAGQLNCVHTVSTTLMGTGQMMNCDFKENPIYVNSFPGTPVIEPVEKIVEAGVAGGVAAGVLRNLPSTVKTESTIHLRP